MRTRNTLYTVSVVAVFGSYLNLSAQRLDDVDVAVRLDSRISDREFRVDKEPEHARNSGRSFSRFFDQLTWAHNEVMLALKAKKRAHKHSVLGLFPSLGEESRVSISASPWNAGHDSIGNDDAERIIV